MEIFYYINLALAIGASVLYLKKFFTESKLRMYFLIFAVDSLIIACLYLILSVGIYLEAYVIRLAFTLLLVTFIANYAVSSVRYKDC